jgi:acylphosphatase
MTNIVAKRFLVSGRVQGVYYRSYTVDYAFDLGILGYVKNLPDGRVEVFAQASPEKIELFKAKLEEGSPASIVTSVDETEEKVRKDTKQFIIKY